MFELYNEQYFLLNGNTRTVSVAIFIVIIWLHNNESGEVECDYKVGIILNWVKIWI